MSAELTPGLPPLHCPCCSGLLVAEPTGRLPSGYGVLRCDCYRYPVLEGIPVLRQLSPAWQPRDPITALLDAGQPNEALAAAQSALGPGPDPPRRATALWQRVRERALDGLERTPLGPWTEQLRPAPRPPPASFGEALVRERPYAYAEYLFFRHANPSFLAALPLLLAMAEAVGPGKRILDLGCGAGHSTFVLSGVLEGREVAAVDADLTNLLLNKRYHAPQAAMVCADVEHPLPFAGGSFAGVFCLDSFHYVRGKAALVAELERVVEPGGPWLFPHLHNAAHENVNPGVPLPESAYRRCFQNVGPGLFEEATVLAHFSERGSLDLSQPSSSQAAAAAPVLTLVGGEGSWRGQHPGLAQLLLSKPALLQVNPIYRSTASAASMRLELAWPNAAFEAECALAKRHLRPVVAIEHAILRDLSRGELRPDHRARVAELVRQFALVALPPQYGGWPGATAEA